MALVSYDPALDSFSGHLGNLVYYRNRSLRCVRSYVIPRNPRTARQQKRRMLFADAVHLWQNLPSYKKDQWNKKALIRHIKGYNLFISDHLLQSLDTQSGDIAVSAEAFSFDDPGHPLRSRSVSDVMTVKDRRKSGSAGG